MSWLARLLLCHLLPLSLLLAVSAGTAAALPADVEAPMCDPMGASVAARPDIPEVDGGRLEILPCEALL